MPFTQNKILSTLAFVVVALCIAQVQSATGNAQVSDQLSKVCSGQDVKATIGQDSVLYPTDGTKGSGSATCEPGQSAGSHGKLVVKIVPDFDLGKNPYCVEGDAKCDAQVSDQLSKVCSGQYVKATIGQDSVLYPTDGTKGSGSATCEPSESASSIGKLVVNIVPDFDLGKNPYCVKGDANCVAVA